MLAAPVQSYNVANCAHPSVGLVMLFVRDRGSSSDAAVPAPGCRLRRAFRIRVVIPESAS